MKKSKRLVPVILYGIFYMVCFAWLERMPVRYHIINSSLDKKGCKEYSSLGNIGDCVR